MSGGRSTGVDEDTIGPSAEGRIRWRAVLVDLAIVAGWVAVVSVAWRWSPWPLWAYYAVVFAGIVGYSVLLAPVAESAG